MLKAFGTTRPECVVCGISDPVVIVRPERTMIENHHIGGKAASGITVPLCRNHHAQQTEKLLAQGVPMRYDHDQEAFESVGAVLIGIGSLLESLAPVLIAVGRWRPEAWAHFTELVRAGFDLEQAIVKTLVAVPLPVELMAPRQGLVS